MTLATTHSEMKGSPTENWSYSQFTAIRRLKVAWGSRFALMEELLTFPGEDYPHHTESRIHCRSVTCAPFAKETGAGSGISEYEHAIVTANYASPKTGDPDDTEISQHLEPTSEFRTLSPQGFKWGDQDGSDLLDDEAPGQQMHGMVYVLTRHNALRIPSAALALVGTTNLENIHANFLDMTFAAQTLLFKPPSIDMTTTIAGQKSFRITYRFLIRPQNWNMVWRKTTQQWEALVVRQADGSYDRYYNFPPAIWDDL